MGLPAFQVLAFSPPVAPEHLARLQANADAVFRRLVSIAMLDGQLLPNVALANGANVVNHGLGRALIGWFPTRVRASATVYDTQDANATPDKTLQLTASAAVTVDLWVF